MKDTKPEKEEKSKREKWLFSWFIEKIFYLITLSILFSSSNVKLDPESFLTKLPQFFTLGSVLSRISGLFQSSIGIEIGSIFQFRPRGSTGTQTGYSSIFWSFEKAATHMFEAVEKAWVLLEVGVNNSRMETCSFEIGSTFLEPVGKGESKHHIG